MVSCRCFLQSWRHVCDRITYHQNCANAFYADMYAVVSSIFWRRKISSCVSSKFSEGATRMRATVVLWLVLKILSVLLLSAPTTIFALFLPFRPIFPLSYSHKWMTSNQPFEGIFLFRGFIISHAFVYVRLKLHGMCLSRLKIEPVPEFRLEWQYSFSLARKDDPFPLSF